MAPANDTFDAETIAVLVYALLESGTVLGSKHYELMSAVDGKRTKSAFEHRFRECNLPPYDVYLRAQFRW